MTFIDGAWEGNDLDLTLNPGEGVFFHTPTAFTQRFLGEVRLSESVPMPSGLGILSSPSPRARSFPDLGFPVADRDCVHIWRCGEFLAYNQNCYVDGAWEGDNVAYRVSVGEAFFFSSETP